MPIPFAKLKVAVKEEKAYLDMREMAFALAKALSPLGRLPTNFSVNFNREMESRALDDAPSAFMASFKLDIPFDIYFSKETENISRIIRNDFHKSKLMADIFNKLGQSHKDERSALVVFKMKHLGYFICHNIEMWKSPTPRIVIPASKSGIAELTIQHIKYFSEDFNKLEGK